VTRDHLLALLLPLPAEATLPVGWIREQLEALEVAVEGEPEVYAVRDLARRWNRAPSTVRAVLEAGELPEAYRHRGREWRVPRAAVLAYEQRQAETHAATPRRRTPSRTSPGDPWGLRRLARGEAAKA
jgi:hypothetical protein